MKRHLLAASAALLSVAVIPALAQERPNPGAGSQGTAVERGAPPSPAPSAPAAPPPSSVGSSGGGSSSGSSEPAGWSGGNNRAVPRDGRAREGRPRSGGNGPSTGGTPQGGRTGVTAGGGNTNDPGGAGYGGSARPRGPHPAQGTAMPRSGGDVGPLPPYWHGDYWDYYYWFPYYGPWSLYLYWDPYMWGDYYPAYGYGGGYGGQPASYYNDEIGSLKLKVKPRTAQVYLDGYLTGVVDDFDGMFQRLKTRAGGHRLEIRQEGFKPMIADVMVPPDATTTFRGALEPLKK